MTREEILRLEGRELDALVHEEILGRRALFLNYFNVAAGKETAWFENDYLDPDDHNRVPDYSADIAAAWQVVERLTAMGYQFELSFVPGYEPEPWLALFFVPPRRVDSVSSALAATATEAICRAALLAVCGEDEQE